MKGFEALAAYMMAKVAERCARSSDETISHPVRAEVEGRPLDPATPQGMVTALILAALDMVAGMLGFVAAFLGRSPGHSRRLISSLSLIRAPAA